MCISPACTCVYHMQACSCGDQRKHLVLWNCNFTQLCVPTGSWASKQGPLEQQPVLLTTESTFQLCFILFCFKTDSHYVALGVLGLYTDRDGLKLTSICLFLPPQCWDQTDLHPWSLLASQPNQSVNFGFSKRSCLQKREGK